MIKQNVRSDILKKYNVGEKDFLGKGQEAEVYAYTQEKVLKLYKSTAFEKQKILKAFYESMESDGISFEVPKIFDIIDEKDVIVTIEKRIEGRNVQKELSKYDDEQLNTFFKHYLEAVLSIQSIKLKTKFNGLKLLNDYKINYTKPIDWNDFLKQSLIQKNKEVNEYLTRDVKDYENKLKRILNAVSSEYKGDYTLIHGDFYPSNLLVDNAGKINGVIDFGLMTLYGDPVFDIALSWLLFDLYEELGEKKLEIYLNRVVDTLGEEVRSKIYLYALYYSIYSANFFSESCSDGHYEWSVRNLNNEKYWANLT